MVGRSTLEISTSGLDHQSVCGVPFGRVFSVVNYYSVKTTQRVHGNLGKLPRFLILRDFNFKQTQM